MKHGQALYHYLNLNLHFHDGNKVMIYHHCSTIKCMMMHLIYFLFVKFFLFFFCSFLVLMHLFDRKCLSMIQYDAYQLNNAFIIPILNNLIHKISLYQQLFLYLLLKKKSSDYVIFVLMSDIHVYFFFVEMCSIIFLFHIKKKKRFLQFFPTLSRVCMMLNLYKE